MRTPQARQSVASGDDHDTASESRVKRPTRVSELTPMLRHYLEVKSQHPDAILLYRMGDFFETFFDDAEIAAPIFEVQLTARQRGTPSEAPMCGVPHHAVEGYIGKLLRAGLKVAVCDQVEDPAQAKGLVRREVTRVVTPGTVTELGLLERDEANLLAVVVWTEDVGSAAFLDISTGSFFVERWDSEEEAREALAARAPKEVLAVEGQLSAALEQWLEAHVACRGSLDPERVPAAAVAEDLLRRQFGVGSLRGFGLEGGEDAVRAAALALEYAEESARRPLEHVRSLEVRQAHDAVILDEATLRNLEVFRNQRQHTRRATLLWAVDRTVTAAGGRLLKEWLGRPLRDIAGIARRLDAIERLVASPSKRQQLRRLLESVADLERLVSRAVLGTLSPLETASLRSSLDVVPDVQATLAEEAHGLLAEVARVDPVADLRQRLHAVLVPEPPSSWREGGVVAPGVDPELDRVRSFATDAKQHLLELQAKERAETGIGSLKVRFNKVFGYYIEVTKSNQHLVPDRYVRKQTLTNAERYFTEELKELEEQILASETRLIEIEQRLFEALRSEVMSEAIRLRTLAAALASADVVSGLAEVAADRDYCRPVVTEAEGALRIREGRHPVVERTVGGEFVPNDLELDGTNEQIVVLTGPNMGGKSTYLRQVALIVLLAQAGSFVPAQAAEVPLVDRIFTRVGASDNLARGESTFMVEMIETSNILRYATSESLIVLDEVGRGTATFDGLSLAWAIVEHLHESSGARTLFATHYHELTELAQLLPRVVNRTMAVKEWREQIVFLHRVIPGSADKSYGLQVARLAGLPEAVIRRAGEVLANLEAEEYDALGRPRLARGSSAPERDGSDQLALFARPEEVVAAVLRDVDTEQLTPLAALNLIQTLKSRLGG